VYFEKLRIKEGKPKGKKRVEMEGVHVGGMDTERRRDRFWCAPGERPAMDRLGRVEMVPHVPRRSMRTGGLWD
jgi:hypothetical protein